MPTNVNLMINYDSQKSDQGSIQRYTCRCRKHISATSEILMKAAEVRFSNVWIWLYVEIKSYGGIKKGEQWIVNSAKVSITGEHNLYIYCNT